MSYFNYTKVSLLRLLYQNIDSVVQTIEIYSHISGGWKSIGKWIWFPMRGSSWLTDGHPLAVLSITWRRKRALLFLPLFIRGINLIMRASWPDVTLIISPKAYHQNHHIGDRTSTYRWINMNFGGIQTFSPVHFKLFLGPSPPNLPLFSVYPNSWYLCPVLVPFLWIWDCTVTSFWIWHLNFEYEYWEYSQ